MVKTGNFKSVTAALVQTIFDSVQIQFFKIQFRALLSQHVENLIIPFLKESFFRVLNLLIFVFMKLTSQFCPIFFKEIF